MGIIDWVYLTAIIVFGVFSLVKFFKKGIRVMSIDFKGRKPLVEVQNIFLVTTFGWAIYRSSLDVGMPLLGDLVKYLTIGILIGFVLIDLLKIRQGKLDVD